MALKSQAFSTSLGINLTNIAHLAWKYRWLDTMRPNPLPISYVRQHNSSGSDIFLPPELKVSYPNYCKYQGSRYTLKKMILKIKRCIPEVAADIYLR